jgi:DNA-directed RNA polymerase subunit RPC12/RpoP
MGETPAEVIGHCGACGAGITADHPYAWCSKCGTSLPAEVKAALGRLHPPAQPPREAGVPLVVEDAEVPCPICRHTRFRKRRTIMEGRAAAIFDMDWASPSAETYICLRCGHVLWFMR